MEQLIRDATFELPLTLTFPLSHLNTFIFFTRILSFVKIPANGLTGSTGIPAQLANRLNRPTDQPTNSNYPQCAFLFSLVRGIVKKFFPNTSAVMAKSLKRQQLYGLLAAA